jgi:hypothetical protein
MKMLLSLAALLGALTLAGCSWFRHETPSAAVVTTTNAPVAADQKFIVTASEGLGGKVAMVNTDLRFVVLTFPVGQIPNVDQHLTVYRNGVKVGEVKVTGPRRNENTVADIVAGEVARGDEVRDK